MYNWIIEADIYRLSKAIREQEDAQERHRLGVLLAAKRQQLSIATAASAPHEPPQSTPRSRGYRYAAAH